MGQKVRPYSFRVGVTKPWRSRWFAAKKEFGVYLVEDAKIRRHIHRMYKYAGIPQVEIERSGDNKITLIIHSAKPGMLISKKTNRLSDLEKEVALLTGGKACDVRVKEVSKPELDAQLAAERIAEQLERRGSYKRAAKREMDMIKGAGAEGCKVQIAGRLGGSDISRVEKQVSGSVPLNTLDADIDYGFSEAQTVYGKLGVKVWIYRGMMKQTQEAIFGLEQKVVPQ
ncbi:MAG: 30S ribosomal protein S3 [Planctomycetes bacterium]|nr:30S ribosomal protein S3 [Planctomycetota bacterium]